MSVLGPLLSAKLRSSIETWLLKALLESTCEDIATAGAIPRPSLLLHPEYVCHCSTMRCNEAIAPMPSGQGAPVSIRMPFTSPFSCVCRCRVALYELLIACITNAPHSYPAITPFAVHILRDGRRDPSREVWDGDSILFQCWASVAVAALCA